ncbi:phenylalanine--tRNA ligase subunit beta [Candidatus Saccharibacteria bacterium]|nr:phenylalanine--tRNA ligase subunit beta [Candidatus Saccharibacteria bacterium]
MIISLNWLKRFVDINIPTDELVELIGARLVEVEGTTDLAPKYKGIKIVEVRVAEKMEGSDHLNKCVVWDGKNEHQVVCGAPNVRAGMLAVWLPPKTILPSSYNEEPLVLEKRKLMGVESEGMLAGVDELDFSADHLAIAEIDPADAKPGDDFADVFELNDTLLDIENKSLTHRPDCFGVAGFAREVCGILGKKYETKQWLLEPERDYFKGSSLETAKILCNIEVEIKDVELCPRYQAVVLELPAKPPRNYLLQMQTYIARSGMRSIDRVVDVTNELMLLTGQPLHAFDYDKLVKVGGTKTPKIIVRAANQGEQLELLDGKTITLDQKDIVITSNNVPVALAGAMGGMNTAIDKNTKRIVVESATFDLYSLRGTQFRHGIFSEAITRFTKGQPPALTDFVIRKAVRVYDKHCNAKQISQITDCYPKKIENQPVSVQLTQINDLLGSDVALDSVISTLTNVGFDVMADNTKLVVTAPYWRTDIHIWQDIAEEVGRINGFDNITPALPKRSYMQPQPDKLGDLKAKIRNILASKGANEVLTYSFVDGELLNNAGQDSKNSYRITNAISPELQYVRQSLTPSLLEKLYTNLDDSYSQFTLFEINKVYQKKWGLTDEGVPVEKDKIALALLDSGLGYPAYYVAKRYADKLFMELGIKVKYTPLTADNATDIPLQEKRRSKIEEATTGEVLGVIGEYKANVCNNFKLDEPAAGFELILDNMIKFESSHTRFRLISRYPIAKRDITLKIASEVSYIELQSVISTTLETTGMWFTINPVDIYQGDNQSTKNITFHLEIASYDKTLNGTEIAAIMRQIEQSAKNKLNAEVI